MMSLIERARELGRELAATTEYKAVTEAKKEVESHAAAKIMYEDFTKKQSEVEGLRADGKTIPEDTVKSLESAYQLMSMNPYIRQLLVAEYAFARLLHQVQKAMVTEVGMHLPEMPDVPQE